MTKNKLWSGRFAAATDSAVAAFTASVQFDARMAPHDIAGSIAHARMLGKTGVLETTDVAAIVEGLEQIGEDIAAGRFEWKPELEDVHMNIEAELTDRIGDAGKRLHTGRSRNDQVATDMRLWTRDAIDAVIDMTRVLQTALIDQAETHPDTVMPGFTHMQAAQPVTLGHHLLAWNEMLERDVGRLRDGRKRLNRSPLGSAALAGTSFPIDREMTAAELGFDGITVNSLDAVSDRDFTIEFTSAAALQMVHLSRMCEEIILWASDAFGFIDISDAFCTGSSIMPQKKNPDVAEIIRGKTARVNGNLHALLMLMKSQPLAYNRDNQEDKEPVFDTVDTLLSCLDLMGRMVPNISFRKEIMREAAARGFSTATDLADYLVRRDVPFRDAHEIVGKTVRHAQDNNMMLDQIELATLKSFSERIESDVFDVLTLDGSVSARNHPGGTAPEQVKKAAVAARRRLAESATV